MRSISMFFPVYNEEKNIPITVRLATKVLREVADDYEIIFVVYESSTDNSISVVKDIAKKDKHVKLVVQPKNMKGMGIALRMGFEACKYDLMFYSDGDNQFDLDEFKKFLPYIDDYDIIAGYRINRQDPFTRIMTSKVYNALVKSMFSVKERDVDCAFRLVNKKVFKRVKLTCRLGLGSTELLVKARKNGFKIKQIAVHHFPRKIGQSVFESGLSLPKFNVVMALLKEMRILRKELHKK